MVENTLTDCILNFATHGRSNGYFTPARWQHRLDQSSSDGKGNDETEGSGRKTAHELSLNPVLLNGPVRNTLAWIVRLMVQLHLHEQGHNYEYQQGYYSIEFYEAMWGVGLPCSGDGTPTGKRTGYTMKHWIEPAGKVAKIINGIPEDYFPWSGEKRRSPSANKPLQYGCPSCGARFKTSKPMSSICTTENCQEPFQLIAL